MLVANNDSIFDELNYEDSIPSERAAFSANENLEKFKMAVKLLRSLRDNDVIDDKQFENLAVHFSAIFLANEFEFKINTTLEKALSKIHSNLWRAL